MLETLLERYHQSFDFEFNQQSSSPSLKQKTFFNLLTNIPFKFKESENLPMCVLLAWKAIVLLQTTLVNSCMIVSFLPQV